MAFVKRVFIIQYVFALSDRLGFHGTAVCLRRDGREFWKGNAIGLQRRKQDCRSTVVGLSVAVRRLYTHGINLFFC